MVGSTVSNKGLMDIALHVNRFEFIFGFMYCYFYNSFSFYSDSFNILIGEIMVRYHVIVDCGPKFITNCL
ncbi:hypothetical protein LPPLD21_02174 [Lactiplantibacillus paraplantarum]|uniref:Uncharacterized protein n=1 Tax=Lactiplantibacillus paraplantarum TaxID=60520 RepID=A0ABQ0NC81_9LACO|nr:hypothetical protein LPPLD21_02174 [Lactiplantibacillus paraplantarum]